MKRKLILAFGSIAAFLLIPSPSLRADVLDHWTTNQVSTNYFGLDCVVYGTNRYVAYGEYSDWGVIMTSEDGKNWTLRSDGGGPSGSGLSFSISLVYTGGRFFALGGFTASGVSTNGIDWDITSSFGPVASGAAFGAGRYVVVGDPTSSNPFSDQNVFTSTDGKTWTARHSTSPTGASLSDVAYGAGLFVAIDVNNGHTYTSTIGTTWTQRSIPGGSQISFCNGLFIVPYSTGVNLLSSDGINWSTQNTGLTNMLGKVTYANGLFLAAVGGHLAISTNGTNWIQYPQTLPGGFIAGTVCCNRWRSTRNCRRRLH